MHCVQWPATDWQHGWNGGMAMGVDKDLLKEGTEEAPKQA